MTLEIFLSIRLNGHLAYDLFFLPEDYKSRMALYVRWFCWWGAADRWAAKMPPYGMLLLGAFFPMWLSSDTTAAFESTTECEHLDGQFCAYSVSSLGLRCVLEQYPSKSGYPIYECQTSSVMAVFRGPWMETDECLASCGLERITVGISSDGLLDRIFTAMLCSPTCVENCVNIIDLYSNIAADEGINLRQICRLFLEPGIESLIPVIPLEVDRTSSVIEGWTPAEEPTSAPSNQQTRSTELHLPN